MTTLALLVISSAYSMREMLARYLSTDDFVVYTADSAAMALPLIPLQPQVVIYELDLNQASGLDLMCWLNHRYPAMHQVILCDTSDTELMQLLKSQRVSVLHKNNFNLMHFRSLLQTLCRHPRGLTYQFSQISLFELVHLASHAEQARHVYLTSHQTAQEGLIYFKGGRVQHAVYDTFAGEEAFYEIMRMKRGLFQETDMGQEAYYTISSGLDQLMALSALKIDQQDGVKMPLSHGTILAPDMVLVNHFVDAYPDVELELFYTASLDEALEQVASRADFLIVDLDLPDLDMAALLETLSREQAALKVILVASRPMPALNSYLQHSQVIRFFLKPGQFYELSELVNQTFLSQQFGGQLQNLSLFSLLQTFAYFRQPRLLELTDFFSGQTGQVFLAEGQVQHASFRGQTGRDALKEMLTSRYGLFRQETYWAPHSHSLQIPFARLLLYMGRFLEQQPRELPREILLQNGQMLTLQAEKIAYLQATQGS
ncbi:MAG: hypothetical protein IGS03_12785 [Candidatus Sericytochromatia bacterium]|nr:hypothetical protein [Candidatus Sericytochromatia bacterium]